MAVAERANRNIGQDTAAATPFPTDVFPDGLRQFVEQTATCLPCPPDFVAAGVLACVSAFVGPHRPLEVKPGWTERPVIWMGTVAPPSQRKTPATEKAISPARANDRQMKVEYQEAKRDYNAAKRQALKNKEEFDEPSPTPKQMITSDVTFEALADVLLNNPDGVLNYRDELTSLVGSFGAYKGGRGADKQGYLSAWSCQDITVNRKGKDPLQVEQPYMSIIGNLPPDMLGEMGDKHGREDGFLDRFLFTFPESIRVKWVDASPDPQLEQDYIAACNAIRELPHGVLTLTAEAKEAFRLWYDEHNRQHDGPAGVWGKMDGYCARLADILHHLRLAYGEDVEPDAVDTETIHRAIKLIDYFKNHARRAFRRIHTDKDGQKLAKLMSFVANSNGVVSPRQLLAAHLAKKSEDAKQMLRQLASLGLGEIVEGRKKGSIAFRRRDDFEAAAEACGQNA